MAGPASVVFYISGHGFGHASREVEVINAIGAARPELTIVVRTVVSEALLARTLRTAVTRLEGPCDTGVIQRDSVTHDDDATVREAAAFQKTMSARVEAELVRLRPFDVRAIVGDIPPMAFDVAARLDAPSIALANFTWDWIYEWYVEPLRAAPNLLEEIRRSYRRTTHALELPLSGGFDVFPRVTRIPFIARHSTRTRHEARRRLGLDSERRVALLSFGGYGLQRLAIDALDCLDDWTVLLTDRITSLGDRPRAEVQLIPESAFENGAAEATPDEGLRYEDLVAGADVVVTKPGYGIVSECIAHDTAMLYTSRGHFREYDRMVGEMPSLLRCRFIEQDDLFAGRWKNALEALMQQPPAPRRVATDGADQASAIIQGAVDRCSAPASRAD
jgi:predicted glycosyltransferase